MSTPPVETEDELQQKIRAAYADYVLTKGEQPPSVYAFCKDLQIREEDFYRFYASFAAVEAEFWLEFFERTRAKVAQGEVWAAYNAREKYLAFLYAFTETLKADRSFAIRSLGNEGPRTPAVLFRLKDAFYAFFEPIIEQGIDSGELARRKLLRERYVDPLWLQFLFVVRFWAKDSSLAFERTDEAIEKGVNLTFDLLARSPIDSFLEFGKFLARQRWP